MSIALVNVKEKNANLQTGSVSCPADGALDGSYPRHTASCEPNSGTAGQGSFDNHDECVEVDPAVDYDELVIADFDQ